MSAKALIKQFNFNHFAIQKNLEGMTHEECLIQPSPGGSCANWIVGHIVATRNATHRIIGEEPVWREDEAAAYQRGTPGVPREGNGLRIDKILNDLDGSQKRLMAVLSGMTASDIAAELPGDQGSVEEQLAGLAFHEAYHAGQLGILRRLAGRTGAIA
jgi:hypothetical protein